MVTMQVGYRSSSGMQTPSSTSHWPTRRVVTELWLIGTALVFFGLDAIGIDDSDATFLIVLMSIVISADIVAGTICLLKGYLGVGWLALTVWLVLPIGIGISSQILDQRWESDFFGSVVGAAIVLVVCAPALTTARRRARLGSFWESRRWTE